MRRSALVALLALPFVACGSGDGPRLLLGATHTLEDSGILAVLTDAFRTAHPEWRLQVVVAGSGEVLEMGRRGDLDVLLTHSPEDELRFVEEGHGEERLEVMESRFLILGPLADPAGIRGEADAAGALARIAAVGEAFVSRGDDSGTHRRELALWRDVGGRPEWEGYLEAGVGMADAMRVAAQRGAYILADLPTWTTLNDDLRLEPLVEGEPRLANPYAVTRVARAARPEGAAAFVRWVTGPEARRMIEGFGVDPHGRPLFR